MTFVQFHCYVEALCLIFDASVTGGRRTAARNEMVGGAPKSRHQCEHGFAADLEPDNPLQRQTLAASAEKLGLWTKVYDDHVHVHWAQP